MLSFDLNKYRWHKRMIIIFSPQVINPQYRELKRKLERSIPEMDDRDLIKVEILTDGTSKVEDYVVPEDVEINLRERYRIDPAHFAAILVGKDGQEKCRWESGVDVQEIFSRIDAMPMRREEIKESHDKEQSSGQ